MSEINYEWSYPYKAEDITKAYQEIVISASAEERADLMRRLDLKAFESLEAKLVLRRKEGGRVAYIKGSFKADLVQICVVSGEDVPVMLEEDIEAWYADADDAVSIAKVRRDKLIAEGRGEIQVLDESEDPEAIIDGVIDLGELVAQNLVLALEPYPHAADARYELGDDNHQEKLSKTENPFAALKDWKENLD